MPIYDYACQSCDVEFEARHSIDSKDAVICPRCKSTKTRKQITACHFVIRESGTVRKLTDRMRRENEARIDLKENYGVERVNPLGRNNSLLNVHKEVKQQGSLVRDRMQQSAAENEIKTRKKQREWHAEAKLRAPARSKMIKELRDKEAMEKRAIKV